MANTQTPARAGQRANRLSPEMEQSLSEVLADTRMQTPTVAAKKVEFLPEVRLLLFHLTDGSRLALPVEDIEDLVNATNDQLAHFDLEGGGRSIHFPDFDGNMYVPTLVEGARGSRKWMQELEDTRAAALQAAA